MFITNNATLVVQHLDQQFEFLSISVAYRSSLLLLQHIIHLSNNYLTFKPENNNQHKNPSKNLNNIHIIIITISLLIKQPDLALHNT